VTVSWSCVIASRAGIFGTNAGCAAAAIRPARVTATAAAPAAPSNLTASASGSTVTLTWLAPASVDPAASYVIEAGSGPGLADLASFDTGNTATTFVAAGVAAGTYYVRVRARNSAGTSPASNEVRLVVGAVSGPCSVPNPPGTLSGAVSGSQVTLNWTAPVGACPSTTYVLEAGSAPGASNLAFLSTASTSFSAAGVAPGTYYVRVRAVNQAGVSAPSNEVVLTVGGGPAGSTSLVNCGRIAADATNLGHTLYINPFPGSSISEVDLNFTSGDAIGSYAARLTVLVNGSNLGTASAAIAIGALDQSVPASFTFSPAVPVAPGSNVRLIATQTAGPAELKFEGQALATCPITVAVDSVSTTQAGPRMPIRIVGAP
jgi:predicted phage tail protein